MLAPRTEFGEEFKGRPQTPLGILQRLGAVVPGPPDGAGAERVAA